MSSAKVFIFVPHLHLHRPPGPHALVQHLLEEGGGGCFLSGCIYFLPLLPSGLDLLICIGLRFLEPSSVDRRVINIQKSRCIFASTFVPPAPDTSRPRPAVLLVLLFLFSALHHQFPNHIFFHLIKKKKKDCVSCCKKSYQNLHLRSP